MYKIDPVKATCMKYENKNHGIQGINDTCFGICAAFSGTNDVYNMDPECSKSCVNLIEKRKKEIFGVGSCDHQVPYRPVIWQQIPRYIPTLLKNGESKQQSKLKCFSMCEQYVPNMVSECKESCILDYNAIVDEPYISQSLLKNENNNIQDSEHDKEPQYKTNPYLWIPISICILSLAIYIKTSINKR